MLEKFTYIQNRQISIQHKIQWNIIIVYILVFVYTGSDCSDDLIKQPA